MATAFEADLAEFVEFARTQLEKGMTNLTPEDVLDLWRSDHPSPEDLAESIAAIERALSQADRGEGLSLEEFERRFCQRHSIPVDQ